MPSRNSAPRVALLPDRRGTHQPFVHPCSLLRSRRTNSSRPPDPDLPDERAKQKKKLLASRHHGTPAQHVIILCGDTSENRLATFAKQVQRDTQCVVHRRAQRAALAKHVACP